MKIPPMREVSRVRSIAASMLVLLAGPVLRAETPNWPAWRGPSMDGTASGADLPVVFGAETNLRWAVDAPGRGESTPVTWGDRLFLLCATPVADAAGQDGPAAGTFGIRQPRRPNNFEVVCLDRHTGKILWRKNVRTDVPHEGHHPDHGFASYSPVTDGTNVWAWFGSRGLHCLTMDGAIRWSRDFGTMKTRNSFGEGSSPSLTDKAVIVVMDQEQDSAIAAVNRDTGAVIWKKPREEVTSWTTPLVLRHGGKTQVVVSGTNRTRSYDPDTGEVIWQCGGQTVNVIPTPVAGFGLVFCTSGYRGNALQAIDPGRTGDLTGTDAVRWEIREKTPYVPSPLLSGKRLYFFDHNKPVLTCVDAETGKPHYTAQAIPGMKSVYASPVVSDGRVIVAGRDGTVAVLKDGDAFEVLAVNRFDDGFDASPAIAGKDLYLRGKKRVYCIRSL